MNSYLLSAALAVNTPTGQGLPDQDAPRYIAKALYREYSLDKIVKRLEKKHVPKGVKKYAPYVGIGIRIATEKQITYRWEF